MPESARWLRIAYPAGEQLPGWLSATSSPRRRGPTPGDCGTDQMSWMLAWVPAWAGMTIQAERMRSTQANSLSAAAALVAAFAGGAGSCASLGGGSSRRGRGGRYLLTG